MANLNSNAQQPLLLFASNDFYQLINSGSWRGYKCVFLVVLLSFLLFLVRCFKWFLFFVNGNGFLVVSRDF